MKRVSHIYTQTIQGLMPKSAMWRKSMRSTATLTMMNSVFSGVRTRTSCRPPMLRIYSQLPVVELSASIKHACSQLKWVLQICVQK